MIIITLILIYLSYLYGKYQVNKKIFDIIDEVYNGVNSGNPNFGPDKYDLAISNRIHNYIDRNFKKTKINDINENN